MSGADEIVAQWLLDRDRVPAVGTLIPEAIVQNTRAYWVAKALVTLKHRSEPTDFVSVVDTLNAWGLGDAAMDEYMVGLIERSWGRIWEDGRGSSAKVIDG